MSIQPEVSWQTLTFLFTDLEGSTRLWERFPEAMQDALERHDAILRAAVERSNGKVTKTTGDGLSAVFVSVLDGVRACLKAQQALRAEPWGETGPMRVRMGLHVGEAEPRGGDYYGPAVNRAARLMAAAHGGQVVLSEAAANLVADLLPEGTALRDLGEHRLKDLDRPEHIFQLLHPDLATDFPPLATLDQRPNNLPAPTTPFIGREAELGEVMRRLRSDDARLLTLTGPGGTGKTRLAIRAAAQLLDEFEDGVYFVDLAPIRDPSAVAVTIGHALGLRATSDQSPLDDLKDQLRDRDMLLLLDNFEQVTEAAPMLAELLRDCPRLKLLVTSRERLHVRGEYVFPVPPLGVPAADQKLTAAAQLTQYEAVRLFIERAQAVKPDFQVTNDNAPAVAEICVRLDGLPLAIELASARIRLFSPQALLERLGSRLDLLRGGARDLPARQRTLRDAIAWSYEMLDTGEQRVFELLAVFAGGCTIAAVEAVALAMERVLETGADPLDALASLEDKSLIRRVDAGAGEPRFLMLETIREYAAERLADDHAFADAARRAHAAYFADATQRQWPRLTGPDRAMAIDELVADIENVRTAWAYWVSERDFEQLDKFVDSLWLLYDARGWYHTTVELTNDFLSVLATTPATPERIQKEIVLRTSLARALLALKGYTAEVEAAFQRALDLSEDAGEVPQLFPVLRGLSSVYLYRGDYANGARMGEKILHLAERLDDPDMRIEGHLVYGSNVALLDNIQVGMDHLETAIESFDPARQRSSRFRLGNNPGVASLITASLFQWMLGFPDRALRRANDAIELAHRLEHPYSLAYAYFHISLLHLWRREPGLSERHAQSALNVAEEYDFQVWKAVASCVHGAARAEQGDVERGLAQVRWGLALYQDLKTPPVFWPLLLYVQTRVFQLAGRPDEGLAMLDDALRIASHWIGHVLAPEFLRLRALLLLDISAENAGEAERILQQAIGTSQTIHVRMLELRNALVLHELWRDQGKADDARRLLSEVYARFDEGFATGDLVEARALLGTDGGGSDGAS